MTDNSSNSVVIERVLDAPVATVWQMWAEAEHFASWYGPMGATIPVAEMDVQVGGKRRVSMAMETPNGPMTMWFVGEYKEIVENQRLVYTESLAHEDGTLMTAEEMGMPPGSPMETEVIVVLEDLGDKTKMTMTHVGVPADSPGAMGWNMAFDKLVERLAG